MRIEPPRPDEIDKLVELARSTGFFNPEDLRVVREMLDEYLCAPDSGEYHWVVYRAADADKGSDEPLGFACYGPAALAVDVYDLYWIAVAREHRDKKIGSALLQFVEDDLRRRNARQLYIETSDSPLYAPTRAFYERRGYKIAAHLADYFDVGDGKVIFVKVFREK